MESQVVVTGKDVNCDRWGHLRRVVRPADISTRVCDVKDFDHCSLAILFQIKFKVEGFNATERLELVMDVVNIEAKSKNSDKGKGQLNVTSCVKTQVVTATSFEHVIFSNVNKQTLSKNSYESTLNNIIEITKYSSPNKVIVITDYV